MIAMRWAAPVLILFTTQPLDSQTPLYPQSKSGGGPEFHRYTFSQGIGLQNASQFTVPFFAGTPIGRRLYIDISTSYARTELNWFDGASSAVTGLTDTQIRTSYTAGSDRAVFSVAVNIPTGQTITSQQFAVARSLAQDFLPFRVSNYQRGFGVTGGLASATTAGRWSLGFAGSLRYSESYDLFTDVPSSYSPGVEARIRVMGRRPVGKKSSVRLSLSFSTFGRDDLIGASTVRYQPGNRIIAEAQVTHQVGRATADFFGWAYTRAVSDTNSVSIPEASEQIYQIGSLWTIPLGRNLTLDPGLSIRFWTAGDDSNGTLANVHMGFRLAVTGNLTIAPVLQYEVGSITLGGQDVLTSSIRGITASLFLLLSG